MQRSINNNAPPEQTTDVTDIDIFEVATTADTVEWVTSTEAAMRLSKSERTVQRYAKKNKLLSKSDDSGRLLIGLPTAADSAPTPNAKAPPPADNDRLWKMLEDKDAKLEALVMQNGYLRAQLESSQEQIKLLEDRQRVSLWRRIWRYITNG